ncbi:hypothetical protein [Halosimplex amylolyticum]|uniref:hypothetical protein n=1 Tax=Halosimplex amylolyticum TaxID=3396616 RepID=UPI003F55C9EF
MAELNHADGDHVDDVHADDDADDAGDDHSETDHLANVEDGCGCTEIWEHLSEQRSQD